VCFQGPPRPRGQRSASWRAFLHRAIAPDHAMVVPLSTASLMRAPILLATTLLGVHVLMESQTGFAQQQTGAAPAQAQPAAQPQRRGPRPYAQVITDRAVTDAGGRIRCSSATSSS
jgi:hypothetical protein